VTTAHARPDTTQVGPDATRVGPDATQARPGAVIAAHAGLGAHFVRAHTRPAAPSYLPELTLHLADDAIALWERCEDVAGTQLPPPFWAFAWAGGQAVARYILDNPDLVAGRRVYDLAAGGGVVAIAAARAGAASVVATEIDPTALAALHLNAAANRVTVAGLCADVLDGPPPEADVVTAGDVFYSREMATRTLGYLTRAARAGATVLVGDPGRAYLPRGLTEVAVYPVPTTLALEQADVTETTVWRLTPAATHS
jgi:predicted nicotinamide N-methyase